MSRTDARQVFRTYEAPNNPRGVELPFCPRCGTRCTAAITNGRERPTCPACRYVHYRNPAPGVCIVLTRDDQVLLGKRVDKAVFGAQWGFPAGFIEFDEDFLTAARREAKEETGLEIAVTGILNVSTNYLTPALHALVVVVAATPVGGELTPGDDLCELRWTPVGGPYPPLAYEADAHLLERLARDDLPCLPVDGRYASTR